MGQKATCRVTWVPSRPGTARGARVSDGKASLEPGELRFAGDFKLTIPLGTLSDFGADDGNLRVAWPEGTATFALGARAAEQWALKIRYPRSRLDKLGVKPTSIVSVMGVDEDGFLDELKSRTAAVSAGRTRSNATIIVYGVTEVAGLARLSTLRDSLASDGMIWVVWPKGQKALREDDVRRVARELDLVDVKVMSFSDRLSGLKLVIPLAKRKA